jgi:hypothetical protein
VQAGVYFAMTGQRKHEQPSDKREFALRQPACGPRHPGIEQRDAYAFKVLDIAGNESESVRLGRGRDEGVHRTQRPRHDHTSSLGDMLINSENAVLKALGQLLSEPMRRALAPPPLDVGVMSPNSVVVSVAKL